MAKNTAKNKVTRSQKQYNREVDLYEFFIVHLPTKTVKSGWQYKEDAKSEIVDNDYNKLEYRVLSEKQLKSMGIENPKEKWKTTFNSGGSVNDIVITKEVILVSGDNYNRIQYSLEGSYGEYSFRARTVSDDPRLAINKKYIHFLDITKPDKAEGRSGMLIAVAIYNYKWDYRSKDKKDASARSKIINFIEAYVTKKESSNYDDRNLIAKAIQYLTGSSKDINVSSIQNESQNYTYKYEGSDYWMTIPIKDVHETIDNHLESLTKTFAKGGKLESSAINWLGDLWFAVQEKRSEDYGKIAENLDKLNVSFKIQNAVSSDAEKMIGRKAISTEEAQQRIRKILKDNGIDSYAKGGQIKDSLLKELRKLQRELNSPRLMTYTEGDTSEAEQARQRERASKKARFDEILKVLNESESSEKSTPSIDPEIQSKIDKLQAVVNSSMVPQSVKDKAQLEIDKLKSESKPSFTPIETVDESVEDKIKKLQAVVNSSMVPQSLKDKAQLQIDQLKQSVISQAPEVKPEAPKAPELPELSPIESIFIEWSEAGDEYDETTFYNWGDFQEALKKLWSTAKDSTCSGCYNKTKVIFKWVNGKTMTDRIDIGRSKGDYNPEKQKIGDYLRIQSGSMYTGNLNVGDRDLLQWSDEKLTMNTTPPQKTKIENEHHFMEGDILNDGKVNYVIREAKQKYAMLTLQDGSDLRSLPIEKDDEGYFIVLNGERLKEGELSLKPKTTPKKSDKPEKGLKAITNYVSRRNIEYIKFSVNKKKYTVGHNDIVDGIYVKKGKGKVIDVSAPSSDLKKNAELKLSKDTVYISKRMIIEAMIKQEGKNVLVNSSDIIDGVYVKKEFFGDNAPVLKAPKMSRTQFEDETYEYKVGGKIEKTKKSSNSSTPKQVGKFKKVMEEFKNGTLTSNGQPVTDRKQALAIAFSESGMSYKK